MDVRTERRIGTAVLVLGVVLAVAAFVVALGAPGWHTKVVGVVAAVGVALAALNLFLIHYRGPEIEAIEPPVVIFGNEIKEDVNERKGHPLRVYVPLTFTNTGAAPGVISNLGLRLVFGPEERPDAVWETDWPGPNDPVSSDSRFWEAYPIEVPPHGSTGRTVKLYVRDYDAERGHPQSPAEEIRDGELHLKLRVQMAGEPTPRDMEWQWKGNINPLDTAALRSIGEAPVYRRVSRDQGI
ncbi:MAG: hypothetical protein FJX74_07990 [Armatimonadetes bacterium]|nr:hypothetical protein [Armatimonadota bacterium]